MRDYLERQELNLSSASTDPCGDMEPDEMRRYVRFLLCQLEEKQEQMNCVLADLSELKSTSKEQSKMFERMALMSDGLDQLRRKMPSWFVLIRSSRNAWVWLIMTIQNNDSESDEAQSSPYGCQSD
jgi:hypothetical protein